MEKIYMKNEIRDFEKKILVSGDCDSFMPMSFTEIEASLCVTYYLQGYEKITTEHVRNPYQLLKVLEKTVLKVKRAENHFILSDRYLIDLDCVYVNEGGEDVKLLFIPVHEHDVDFEKSNKVFGETILDFLEAAKCSTEEIRSKEYVDMLLIEMKRRNLSKQGIINYIGELKREAYICGWG